MTEKVEVVILDRPRYEELLEREAFLNALKAAGVDNWEGYDYAQEAYSEEKEIYE